MPKIPISEIKPGDRMRTDYGDIDSLMESLSTLGQIQPIVISQHGELVAGGRRYEAARRLGWTAIEVVVRQIVAADDLREIELEENIQRKDMHWFEKAKTLTEIYRIRKNRANRAGDKYTFRQAGESFGVHFSYVNNLVRIVEAAEEDPSIAMEPTLQNAITRMLKHEADRTARYLAEMHKKKVLDEIRLDATKPNPPQVFYNDEGEYEETNEALQIDETPARPTKKVNPLDICVLGDSVEWLTNHPLSVDHIFTDIPYGIDMDALDTIADIERTKDEHDVEENISLMSRFLKAASIAIKPKGWLVFFFDLDHFDLLKRLAKENGFNVQRWPVIMHKTSGAKNSAAGVNFTKDYESVFIARKPGATLVLPQSTSVLQVSYTQTERRIFSHPFSKPREVCKRIVEAISTPGQVVCDPFAGEGSLALSILAANRQPVAIEKMELHYNLMLTHMSQALSGSDPVTTSLPFVTTNLANTLL